MALRKKNKIPKKESTDGSDDESDTTSNDDQSYITNET